MKKKTEFNRIRRMKQRKTFLLLFVIVFTGFIVRVYGINRLIMFHADQLYDLSVFEAIWQMVRRGEFWSLPIIGETGTPIVNNGTLVRHGVFFFYFHTPFAALAHFDLPRLLLVLMIFHVGAIPIFFAAGKELFNEKVGLLAAGMFAVSYWMIAFSRKLWTPSLIPFFTTLSLFTFAKILHGNEVYWPLFALAVSGVSQLHNSGYIVLFLMVAAVVAFRVRLPKRKIYQLGSIVLFVLPILPTIITEVRGGFEITKTILDNVFFQSSTFYRGPLIQSFPAFLSDVLSEYSFALYVALGRRSYVQPLLGYGLPYLFGLLILVLWSFLHIKDVSRTSSKPWITSQRLVFFWFVLFLPFPWIAKAYYGSDVYNGESVRGLLGGFPYVFLAVSVMIWKLWAAGARPLAAYLLLGVVVFNMETSFVSLLGNAGGDFGYGDKRDLVALIDRDRNGRPFEISFTNWHEHGQELMYLFDRANARKPERFNGEALLTKYGTWSGPIELTNGPAEILYTIVGNIVGDAQRYAQGVFLGKVGNFLVYREELGSP